MQVCVWRENRVSVQTQKNVEVKIHIGEMEERGREEFTYR